jgi:hypothetical protein
MSGTHYRELLAIEDPMEREFSSELCRSARRRVRTLRRKLDHPPLERSGVSYPTKWVAR